MKERYSMPENEAQLLEWLVNFSSELSKQGNKLGITWAEIASLNALIYSVTEDLRHGRSEEARLKKEAMAVFIYRAIDKMKTHPSFRGSGLEKYFDLGQH